MQAKSHFVQMLAINSQMCATSVSYFHVHTAINILRCIGYPREHNSVADPEGVHWVPWNPSFEELPSKILCANILRTRRSHWSYALQLHISNNARVSTPLSRIRRAHDLCSRIMSEASERIKAKVLFVYYIFPLQLRMAI